MSGKSATRAIKNAKFIRAVSPEVFGTGEPADGYASVLPFAVLDQFHRLSDQELRPYPQLRKAARLLRRAQRASVQKKTSPSRRIPGRVPGGFVAASPFPGTQQPSGATTYGFWGNLLGGLWGLLKAIGGLLGWAGEGLGEELFGSSPFTGMLFFLKLTFIVGDSTVVLNDTDLATIREYTSLALPAIANYTAHYGASETPLTLSNDVLEQIVTLVTAAYTSDDLESWVQTAAEGLTQAGERNFCIIVCSPPGVHNTTTDAMGAGGFHDAIDIPDPSSPQDYLHIPYCFVNVSRTGQTVGLTVDDRSDDYAKALSHEIAEMIMDPRARPWVNPEVCDPCEAATDTGAPALSDSEVGWKAFFQVTTPDGFLRYLGSSTSISTFAKVPYTFFIAAVVQPQYVGDDPAPDFGCNYGPDDRGGVGQLLLYAQADSSSQVYSVDGSGNLALQTVQRDGQVEVHASQIVSGVFMSRSDADPRGVVDLFCYNPLPDAPVDAGGHFVQTGLLGAIVQKDFEFGLRTTWSLIVPGHFSDSPYTDLLFYDPTVGEGVFYHTNNGLDGPAFAVSTGWNTTWSLIIPGHFSDSPYTDLLFYDPTLGMGEFYHTNANGFDDLAFGSFTGWRTTWSLIVPGHFSDSPYTDLLFYDPTAGLGEFYHTNANGFDDFAFASYTGWQTNWSIIKGF